VCSVGWDGQRPGRILDMQRVHTLSLVLGGLGDRRDGHIDDAMLGIEGLGRHLQPLQPRLVLRPVGVARGVIRRCVPMA
jgi:hypothetical protein